MYPFWVHPIPSVILSPMKSIHTDGYRALLAWLREQRLARDLSMRELAERLGVPHSWVGKIETGERRLDLYEYLRLCSVLECAFKKGIDVLLRADAPYSNEHSRGNLKVAEERQPSLKTKR